MKRKIIQIDEDKCNGCGLCVNICAEAALELVDSKARLTKDFYCDGMGACLDVCPVEALKIVEIEAKDYNPEKTFEHVKEIRGEAEAKKVHGYSTEAELDEDTIKCGCPGTMMQDFQDKKATKGKQEVKIESELRQWPIQLHLLTPQAPYFKGADLVISADCVPFSFANFHQKFLKGKILIMFCPKLDEGQKIYIEKLTEILKTQDIKSITIARMEVPCCGGVTRIVEAALRNAQANIIIKDYIISLQGEII